ncbi:MAG: metallophosphoesterase [Clostridia bacterium]|nr:metallophosphoesterase [Clostridia bacterium]
MRKNIWKRAVGTTLATAFVSAAVIGGVGALAQTKDEVVVSAATAQTFDENNIVLTAATITDPHIGYQGNDTKLNNTLGILKEFAGTNEIDMFISAGDNTQDGTKEEADYFMEILANHYDLSKIPIVAAHGNHDVYWTGCMTRSEFYDAFNAKGMYTFDKDLEAAESGNRHVEVNGYHFLTVDIETYMPGYNTLSATTETWLQSKLQELSAESPNEPIFVISHSPAMHTIHGSINVEDDAGGNPIYTQYGDITVADATAVWGASLELDGILKDYPQVINISGHTHYANNHDLAIMQTTYTSFTPGGAADLAANKDTAETASGVMPNARSHSQGTLMQIDANNNVRITRIDFVKKQQIREEWIIPAPQADGSHLTPYSYKRGESNQAPTFASNEKLDVVAESANSVKVTYPTATDDGMVYSYRITLKDSGGNTVKTVTTLAPWVYYPDLSKIPETLSYTFSGVNFSHPCTIEVVAIDCWNKESEPLTKIIEDPTEADIRLAAEFDSKVTGFGSVTANSFEDIAALRNEYNAMSYTRKARVTKYEEFKALEKSFYQGYAVSQDVQNKASDASAYYNMISSASRGTATNSDFCGIDLKWTDTTKNQLVGFNKALALDGLTVEFGGLDFSSKNKTLGFVISSLARDKYTSGESLLLQIDFTTGNVSIGDGTIEQMIGEADCLKYDNVVSRPVQLKIVKSGETYAVAITVYGMESVSFDLPANAVSAATNLTDTSAVFISVSPWDKNTYGEMNLYAIHGDIKYADGGDETPDETPNEPSSPNLPTAPDASQNGDDAGEKESGCGSVIGGTFAISALAMIAVAVLKKRK